MEFRFRAPRKRPTRKLLRMMGEARRVDLGHPQQRTSNNRTTKGVKQQPRNSGECGASPSSASLRRVQSSSTLRRTARRAVRQEEEVVVAARRQGGEGWARATVEKTRGGLLVEEAAAVQTRRRPRLPRNLLQQQEDIEEHKSSFTLAPGRLPLMASLQQATRSRLFRA